MTEESLILNAPSDLSLGQLADYYLHCLTYERRPEVSAWARSKWDLDYVELSANPINGDELFTRNVPDSARLEIQVRQDGSKELYVGYLAFLRIFKSKKGSTIHRIYPLIVRPARNPELPASFNPEALKYLLGGDGGRFSAEELVDLEAAVGLSGLGVDTDLSEVCSRLKAEHPDWNWLEEPDPEQLVIPGLPANSAAPRPTLARATEAGIYNRATLLIGEAQKFTVGLESELADLRKPRPATPDGSATAIDNWLRITNEKPVSADEAVGDPESAKNSLVAGDSDSSSGHNKSRMLLEPLPLNSEQREAVQKALSQDLTVITGPPGTGKSQVVSTILLNAAFRGTSVLFASKNNKAVDVVEQRVNALGPRPVLLRLGSRDHQSQLSEYLSKLLALRSTQADQDAYDDAVAQHELLNSEFSELELELSTLVAHRNRVDQLERSAEDARRELTPTAFASARTSDPNALRGVIALSRAVDRADRKQQGVLTRLIWSLLANKRTVAVLSSSKDIATSAATLEIAPPTLSPGEDIDAWITYAASLKSSIDVLPAARKYLQELDSLTAAPSTSDVSRKRVTLLNQIARNSKQVWDKWLRIQPSLLTASGRKLLGEYQGALSLTAGGGRRAGPAKVIQLFPQVSRHLTCWGVTSLSARGRIPLEEGFFDLLVIDEASQCDIASALPLLYRAKRAVIIGDPMQLRHVSSLEATRDEQLLERSGMLDHLDWSYSGRSLFDLASSVGDPEDLVTLRDHHRSHADIIEFSNQHFYDGQLRVATRYETLKSDDGPAVRWIHVDGQVQRQAQGSVYNTAEVHAVVTELERLADQGYKGSVGAVSPFRPQANRIRDAAYSRDRLARFLHDADFQVGTAHSFQGDERGFDDLLTGRRKRSRGRIAPIPELQREPFQRRCHQSACSAGRRR
ncbi:MAG: AAA domain-containing protein [Acidimicrobiia bacterium]|nr:AAA domain-containing protein [Acidimicrobiia bacterium]